MKKARTPEEQKARDPNASSAGGSRGARFCSAPAKPGCSACCSGGSASCRSSTPRNIGCSPTRTGMTVQLAAPRRGSIYDRFGRAVAEEKENFRILVVPAFCKDLSRTLAALARIVPFPPPTRTACSASARRQSGYFPVLVTEGLTWRQFALLNVLAPQLPGVRTDRATFRHLQYASSMAHVVGYVGMADKGEVDEDPVMRVPGFRLGKTGIEKGFDRRAQGPCRQHQLRGRRPRPRRARARLDAERAGQGPRASPSITSCRPSRYDRIASQRRGSHRRARLQHRRRVGDGLGALLQSQRHRL